MSPDRRNRRVASTPRSKAPAVRTGPSSDDAHAIVFFRRHEDDDPSQRAPGREALNSYPASVRAKKRAALLAVATAPPKRFAGRRVLGGDEGRHERLVRGADGRAETSPLPAPLPP
jgi:hypothetical protein